MNLSPFQYGSERAWSGAESGAASEDEEKKNRRNARLVGHLLLSEIIHFHYIHG